MKKYLPIYQFILYNLILVLILYNFTNTHPLDMESYKEEKIIINWITNNTKSNATFFVKNFNTFMIRAFAKRAVFIDSAWPFNESALAEWKVRNQIINNSSNYNYNDYLSIRKKYSFEYLLLSTKDSNNLFSIEPIFTTQNWAIYSLN